jgi:AraC family transcriptional regulator
MNPVSKALWYIESHFAENVSLDDVARASGVSRFYMSRAFATLVGVSMMAYLRGRRLSEASKKLADGAEDILSVALAFGYGSHGAFTRAFRDQFGVTPESVRANGHVRNLALLQPIRLEQTMTTTQLPPPRFEDHGPMLVVGLMERYTQATRAGIPAQWQRFIPHIGNVPGQANGDAYGVCYNTDDEANMDYLAGVEVRNFANVPQDLERLRIPQHHYAVFEHREHISSLQETYKTIFGQWLPASGYDMADAPLFERYPPSFDGRTGAGGLEVWIPVEKKS